MALSAFWLPVEVFLSMFKLVTDGNVCPGQNFRSSDL